MNIIGIIYFLVLFLLGIFCEFISRPKNTLLWMLTYFIKPKQELLYQIIFYKTTGKNYFSSYYATNEPEPIDICKEFLKINKIKYKFVVEVPLSGFETKGNIVFKVY